MQRLCGGGPWDRLPARVNVLSDNLVSQIKQTQGKHHARWMEPHGFCE
jgi:hypothetical protein